MKNPVSPEVLARITSAGEQGREARKRGAIAEAEAHFLDAWNALPEPKLDQDYAYVDFLSGTVAFDAGDLDEAYRLFDGLFLKFGSGPFEGSDQKYLDFYRKRSGK